MNFRFANPERGTLGKILFPVCISFLNRFSENFKGLANYIHVFTNRTMLTVFRSNALWVAIFAVYCRIAFAVLLDRLCYGKKTDKSIIFCLNGRFYGRIGTDLEVHLCLQAGRYVVDRPP